MSKKLRYELDASKANITVHQPLKEGGEATLILELNAGLKDVSRRLALMGLTQHLQRATTRDKTGEPFDVIEAAYAELVDNGLAAFERKMPVGSGAPRKPTKAQCTEALAALYNTTMSNIREKLKAKTTEEVAAILSNQRVLDKVEELRSSEDIQL